MGVALMEILIAIMGLIALLGIIKLREKYAPAEGGKGYKQ
jgi:hypothetical protein